MRALLSPASLKGVLSARSAAAALGRGVRDAGVEAASCRSPTGEKGRPTRSSAALGGEWREAARLRTRSGDRSRRAGWCFRTAGRSWRLRPRSGFRFSRRRSGIRSAPRAAGSGSCSSPSRAELAVRARRRARRHRDGGRRRGPASGRAELPLPTIVALRRAHDARRRRAAVRSTEGCDRRTTSPSSSGGCLGMEELGRTRSCPARAPQAGSGPRSPRSGPSSSRRGDRARPGRLRRATRRVRPRGHGRGRGRHDHRGGQGAGRGRAPGARGRRSLRRLRRTRARRGSRRRDDRALGRSVACRRDLLEPGPAPGRSWR